MAMKYHKILVAVDGSKTSELAFKKQLRLLKGMMPSYLLHT